MKIPEAHYSCTSCGRCCRDWHVYLSRIELERLKQLSWGATDGIPSDLSVEIGGTNYVAHRENGACIYLDEATNLCKIHSKFGEAAKPLGCRVYPWNVVTTFPGEFSAIPRLDCPPARQCEGASSESARLELRGFVADLKLNGGFDKDDLEGVEPARMRRIIGMIYDRCVDNEPDGWLVGRRLNVAAERFESLTAPFINDLDLDGVLPSTFDRINSDAEFNLIRKLPLVHRWNLASLLAGYLRRDEETLAGGPAARLNRTITIAKMVFGGASLRELGREHPEGMVESRLLFNKPIENFGELDWQPWLTMVRLRLQAYQFFGPANYGNSVYDGLRALSLTMPLVLATAKWAALARDASQCVVRAEDMDYAVGAIDHSFGRSKYLSFAIFRKQARQLAEPDNYRNLTNALLARNLST